MNESAPRNVYAPPAAPVADPPVAIMGALRTLMIIHATWLVLLAFGAVAEVTEGTLSGPIAMACGVLLVLYGFTIRALMAGRLWANRVCWLPTLVMPIFGGLALFGMLRSGWPLSWGLVGVAVLLMVLPGFLAMGLHWRVRSEMT